MITSGWDDPGRHGKATEERFSVIASTEAEKNSLFISTLVIMQYSLFIGGESESSDDEEASASGRSRPTDLILNASLNLLDLLEL